MRTEHLKPEGIIPEIDIGVNQLEVFEWIATLPKFNISVSEKNDGWKEDTSLSFLGWYNFQGRTVKLPGGNICYFFFLQDCLSEKCSIKLYLL